MVCLGFVKVGQRQVFHDDGLLVLFLLLRQGGGDHGLVGRVGVVHAAAVLLAPVVALLVQAGGIDHAQVVLEDVLQAQAVGIPGHAHGFGVAAVAIGNIFIAGLGAAFAVGIAGNGVNHAGHALEIGFQPPEAAACKVNGASVHGLSFL